MQPSTSKRNIKGTIRRVVSWLAVIGIGVGGWFAYGSEPVQRALGNREQFRVEPPEVRPEYASAVIESVSEYVYPVGESTISSTVVTTVDRETERASVSRTNALTGLSVDGQSVPIVGVLPGVAVPEGTVVPAAASARIVTFDAVFRKGATDADPWTRSPRPPYVGGTELDPYLIPTIDDVIGFELAAIPGRDPRAEGGATGEIEATTMQEVLGPEAGTTSALPEHDLSNVPEDVVDLRRWTTDDGTWALLSPVGHDIAGLDLPDGTRLVFTYGFDADGLLRYLDVEIDPAVAVAGLDHIDESMLSFEWRVTSVSDDAITIDLPANVVDATPSA
ncbi:MAG: hypothetical protein NTZ21_09155 [Actinobacteria bacterium]|nr:hypothetical protein [Actinomycetota bacterium]